MVERFYIASRIKHAPFWQSLRPNVAFTSTWIDEAGEGETACFTELWDRIFQEIAIATKLVLYAKTEDFPLKGALIECGMALALKKPVIVCLPEVELEGRTLRPIGSWIHHRLVTREDRLFKALNLI